MSLPASSSEANPFLSLHEGIQRWIWSHGWTELRTVQARAIPALLPADHDVILAAATSAGKTEAAFFPILTKLLQPETNGGVVLSISPLKALINDQSQRLGDLCEPLDVPVLGWHGDVPASRKQRFLKQLSGVLIITPESLEAFMVNKGTTVPALAASVRYVVVDELHSFIGTERGKQVQSLMARLEMAAGRSIPRVGLSATLGDKSLAAEFLRPGGGEAVETIDAASEGYELKLIVKCYLDEGTKGGLGISLSTGGEERDERPEDHGLDQEEVEAGQGSISARLAIAKYLYSELRGTNNLVFPNSRTQVEYFTDRLRRYCERDQVPNEFWAHHGSLSRDLREEAEYALKGGDTAATAVCTTTLELGIDIGSIRSVAQIGPPPSVASLRQRLGRSGRRAGEAAILRCLCIEPRLTSKSTFSDRIREGLLQTTAMASLLLQSWVEPPRKGAIHASTLVQQVLSVIAQRGGATTGDLWAVLVQSGTFRQVSRDDFVLLLRALGEREILQQESSGLLLPGPLGEKLVNNYEFYSAFVSGEEFRLIAEGRSLGSLPISRPLTTGQRIIFAGRRWRVVDVDTEHKVITVKSDSGGAPPAFEGGGSMVHDHVRAEMHRLLSDTEPLRFLDRAASECLNEARDYFRAANLNHKPWFVDGSSILMPTWRGDWVNDGLALLLTAHGLQTSNEGIALRVHSTDSQQLKSLLRQIGNATKLSVQDLHLKPELTIREKWDWALPDDLRLRSFASLLLDLDGTKETASILSVAVENS
jgi:ATP-dependent Lhr-like helicase